MNIFIDNWELTINGLIKTAKLVGEKLDKKELAKNQLTKIEETRPNKTKTVKEQCNQQQLEFIEYLERIIKE